MDKRDADSSLENFEKLYIKGASQSITVLWYCVHVLRCDPSDLKMRQMGFHAAHTLKGTTLTMNEVLPYLTGRAADENYVKLGQAAARLEEHLWQVTTHGAALNLEAVAQAVVEIEMHFGYWGQAVDFLSEVA